MSKDYELRITPEGVSPRHEYATLREAQRAFDILCGAPHIQSVALYGCGYEIAFWRRNACQACQGRGREMTYERDGTPAGMDTCWQCMGTGTAPVEPTAIELEHSDAAAALLEVA